MSVIADFTVPADSFTLHQALTAEPEMTVEAERLASHSAEWLFPFHWATGGDFETFHEAMEDDPTVANATAIEESEDSVLYQIEWSDEIIDLVTEITDQHASIIEAKAHGEKWRLQLRFAEEGGISTFQEHFEERGRSFEVNRIYRPSAPRQREFGLTAEQRDALVTAFQKGYFTVPRALSIEELADVLNISSNAVSQRIRRGSATLIQHTLTIGTGETTDES